MKTPFLKKLTVACLILLSVFITSCTDNNDATITDPTNAATLKTAVRSITSPNATITNPNSMNHSTSFLDDFECFDLVFPLEVTDGTQNTTINDYNELLAYYSNLPANTDPNFVYPIMIQFEDGTQENIQNQQQLEDEFEECFEELNECFTLNFPLTVTDGNGNNATVNDENGLADFYDSLPDGDEAIFVYPITVTMNLDNSIVTINTEDEFDDLYESCYDFDDEDDFDDFDCFTIQYPIDATSIATGTISINSNDELENYFETLGDDEDPDFSFPITITFEDGTEEMINSLDVLEEEFDSCYDDEIEDEDCFTFNYPLTLVKEDSSTVIVNSDDEFDTFIDGLPNDDGFSFQYPFSVTLENGQTQTINSEGNFFLLFDNCL
jgi:hypothetical protein